MNILQKKRTAQNYLQIKGQCSHEARVVQECLEENGSDCGRYWRQFQICAMDEFCPGETMRLRDCHDEVWN